jgi:hypothetical protein
MLKKRIFVSYPSAAADREFLEASYPAAVDRESLEPPSKYRLGSPSYHDSLQEPLSHR